MARANAPIGIPEVDALPGYPLPHERDILIGHTKTEQALLDAYRSERLHHAWILGGPKGIGKATLAFRFARFVIANPDRFGQQVAAARDLAVAPDHPVSRQLKAGGHPNILHLRRPWDEKSKRFKADLPVDEVRRTVSFFGTTASAKAWRICIVDAADDMNISSQDLSGGSVASADDLRELAQTADGSLRSAITLLSGDGLAIAKGVRQLADRPQQLDLAAAHALADLVAARGQSDNWESFQHIVQIWLHDRMRRDLGKGVRDAHGIVEIWEKMNRAIRDADALNLDKKQVVLDFFFALRAA